MATIIEYCNWLRVYTLDRFVFAIVVAHVIIATWLSATLSISSDESCSLVTTNAGLDTVVLQSVRFEWQPPLYFICLWVWRLIDPSIVWARLLSVLFSSLSIIAFFRFTKDLSKGESIWPRYATALYAVHPFLFCAATDIRLYSFGLLLNILLMMTFWRGYIENRQGWTWFFIAAGTISLYTNALLALVLVAQFTTLASTNRWKEAKKHGLHLVFIGLLYLPMFLFQLQNRTPIDSLSEKVTLLKAISFSVGSVTHSILPIPRIDSTLTLRSIFAVVLVVAILGIWFGASAKKGGQTRSLAKYLVANGIFLGLFLFVMNLSASIRYSYPLIAIGILFAGKMSETIPQRTVQYAFWFSVILVGCIATTHENLRLSKSGDWENVANHIESRIENEQPIVAFPSEVATILEHYLKSDRLVIPVPERQRMDRFLFSDFTIPSKESVRSRLNPILSNVDVFWTVTFDGAINESPIRYNENHLNCYLLERFESVESIHFNDSTLTKFQRVPDSKFSSDPQAAFEIAEVP